MSFKKKSLAFVTALVAVVLAAFGSLAVAGVFSANNDQSVEDRIVSMQERKSELEAKANLTDEEDRELRNLVLQIGKEQVADGSYDYKEELERRVSTLEAVIEDGKNSLKILNYTKAEKAEIKKELKEDELIAKHYREILDNADSGTDYKQVADAYNEDFERLTSGSSALGLAG